MMEKATTDRMERADTMPKAIGASLGKAVMTTRAITVVPEKAAMTAKATIEAQVKGATMEMAIISLTAGVATHLPVPAAEQNKSNMYKSFKEKGE